MGCRTRDGRGGHVRSSLEGRGRPAGWLRRGFMRDVDVLPVRRLAASDRPNRIFDAVTELVAQNGVRKTGRALDSTVLDDGVATQDTVTQLVAALRQVGRVRRRPSPGTARRMTTTIRQAADRLG